MTVDDLLIQGRMLTTSQVLSMWPISRQGLWRVSNTKRDADRLPSYKIGGKRLYRYDELMWYLDKHRTMPSETFTTKNKGDGK